MDDGRRTAGGPGVCGVSVSHCAGWWVPRPRRPSMPGCQPANERNTHLDDRQSLSQKSPFRRRTGKAHETQTEVLYNRFTVSQAVVWGEKWAGPKGSFAGELADLKYTLLNHEDTEFKLERLVRSRTFDQFPDEGDEENGLQLITKEKAKVKMKTPPAEAVWKTKVGNLPWPLIWRIRAEYISPRDKITWMKVRHRRVAKSGGMNTTKCAR
jgi:hypothetical protein